MADSVEKKSASITEQEIGEDIKVTKKVPRMLVTLIIVFAICICGVTPAAVLVSRGGESSDEGFPDSSCPSFTKYCTEKHEPLSKGELKLPYQRPEDKCKTFRSDAVEKVVSAFNSRIEDPDLARLFENCFPNVLDTTIRWHVDNVDNSYGGPRTFVITGDKNAEWIRDSRNQLTPYMSLANYDDKLKTLLKGAILTQAEFINKYPYCNALQAPAESNIKPQGTVKEDVTPKVTDEDVYHCQWQVDSVANFFALANDYHQQTNDTSFLDNKVWYEAVSKYVDIIKEMQRGTFRDDDTLNDVTYTFQHESKDSLTTTSLKGHGNPMTGRTGMVRTFARPSDDFGFLPILVPANAMLAAELNRTGQWLSSENKTLSQELASLSKGISQGVWEHGTFNHTEYGRVFAYEVDGYGSLISMDDANIPSLLSLPDLGFLDRDDETYQNTRKMILDQNFNPYYVEGKYYSGIGGPHSSTERPWTMSNAVRIRTSDDDNEIQKQLNLLKGSTAGMGLMHESINAHLPLDHKDSFTRPWFAWMNSEFAVTMIDLAARKPHLIFKEGQGNLTIPQIFGE